MSRKQIIHFELSIVHKEFILNYHVIFLNGVVTES
jgi:hypothetical protein